MKTRHAGFTLIELLIVIVIVGILAAIAYPAYNSSVRKAKRTDAQAQMLNVQIAQEKYRANNTQYAANLAAVGITSSSIVDGQYTLATAAIGGSEVVAYTVTATAVGGKDQANDKAEGQSCSTLTITVSAGAETRTPAVCW